jgi:hypothetical protein
MIRQIQDRGYALNAKSASLFHSWKPFFLREVPRSKPRFIRIPWLATVIAMLASRFYQE